MPGAIPLAPEVNYGPGTQNPFSPFNANGIRSTQNGRYIVFEDTNDGKLYRLTSRDTPADREIQFSNATDNSGGLELRGYILYAVDNQNELIIKVKLSGDYPQGRMVNNTTNPEFAYTSHNLHRWWTASGSQR